MDRKTFLSLLGLSTAGAFTSCLQSCKTQDNTVPAATNVDFTLDLTLSSNAVLKSKGGYLISNGVIVAQTLSGSYIAVSAFCTHEGATLNYSSSANDFFCTRHGATFTTSGTVTGGPAHASLSTYKTQLSGNKLRVYS